MSKEKKREEKKAEEEEEKAERKAEEEKEERAEEEEKAEEEKKEKPRGKRVKVKRAEPKLSSFYVIKGERAERIRRFCSKCGPGYFMAEHSDRFVCGNCGYTVQKSEEST